MKYYAATRPGAAPNRDPFARVDIPTFLRGDARALCADYDPELWFDKDNEEARRICRRCPLQQGCGTWGFQRQEWGVWAGVGSGSQRLGTKMQLKRADDDRRRHCLDLLATGLSLAAVAERVGLHYKTVFKYQQAAA